MRTNTLLWLWVPAFVGTAKMVLIPFHAIFNLPFTKWKRPLP